MRKFAVDTLPRFINRYSTVMPYPFPEYKVSQDLEPLYECSDCCGPPTCGTPDVYNQWKFAQQCFYSVYDEEEQCWKKYRTRKQTQQSTVVNDITVINGTVVVTETTVIDRTKQTTYEAPSDPCEETSICTIADTYTYRSYCFQVDPESGNVIAIFPQYFIDETYELGEDPCTYVVSIRVREYECETDEDGNLIGSTLISDVTTESSGMISVSADFEYLDPVDCEDLRALLVAPTWDDEEPFGGWAESEFNCEDCAISESFYLAQWSRFKWQVPPCYPGSYYKIEWDEIFYPAAFDEWLEDAQNSPGGIFIFNPNDNPPPVLPTLTHREWEWTGTALGDCTGDPAEFDERNADQSRFSEFFYIDPPMTNGRIAIGNVTALCYRSPFGNLPDAIDAYDIFDFGDVDKDGIKDTLE